MDFISISTVCILMCALGSHAAVLPSSRQARLSLAEPMPSYYYSNINGQPGTYAFGYEVRDPQTGLSQYRTEERYPNGTVVGTYGYNDGKGRPHLYKYIADEKGYRLMTDSPYQPVVPRPIKQAENLEPSVTWSRPKKPNRNPNKSYLNKLPIKKNTVDRNTLLHPPSYYAIYD